jgi:hypothetical protein
VHDGVNIMVFEDGSDLIPIGQISFDEACLGMDRGFMSVGEIVENNDISALRDQLLRDDTADVTCPTSDQDTHVKTSSMVDEV